MNQIALNVDCMEYMQALPDKAFDLAIVDPPYGISIHDSGRLKKYNATETRWDDATPGDVYFSELKRCSKNQIIWGGNYYDLPPCRGFVIWDKSSRKIFLCILRICMDFFRYICENFLLLAVARKGAKNSSNAKARGIVRVVTDEVRQRRLAHTGYTLGQWKQQDSGLQPRL